MRIIISILLSILFYQTYAQTTWSKRRDWVVGRYEGYYVHGDTTTGTWYPLTFDIIYIEGYGFEYDSLYVRVSGFSGGLPFAVCEDSVLGAASGYLIIHDSCVYYSPFTGDGGKLYPDNTYEHWWYCPPAYCYEHENWQFFRGKKVKSYANSMEQIIDFNKVNVFPNPAIDIITIKRNNLDIEFFEIYDLTGKLLLKKEMRNKDETINISFLNSGLYVFKVRKIQGILELGKLIKQ